MSIEAFVRWGAARRLIGERDGGVYGKVQLFDIGLKDYVGARYPDGSDQAHPAVWYPRDLQRKLEESLRTPVGRPRLPQERTGRPRLAVPISKRPRLRG